MTGSNRRPWPCKSPALPAELIARIANQPNVFPLGWDYLLHETGLSLVCGDLSGVPKAHVSPIYRAAFTGDRRNVPLARNAIAGFARVCGFSAEEVYDIRLASGEAISNAVEHGQTLRSHGFSVRCTFFEDELTIEIRDSGEGFSLEGKFDETPINERARGFGIFLMRRLMDGVHFDRGGTCVRLTRRHVS
jgi:serine/threonine-protein kinase RsbW